MIEAWMINKYEEELQDVSKVGRRRGVRVHTFGMT